MPSAGGGSTRPPTTAASPSALSARLSCASPTRWSPRDCPPPGTSPSPPSSGWRARSTAWRTGASTGAATRECTTCGPRGGPWGWRLGGHHVSLNNLIVDGVVRGVTPCFLGADPARAPLRGPEPLRPLAGTEDVARQLVRSLDAGQARQAIVLGRAPSDIIGGNRSQLADGDEMVQLRDIWRGYFAERELDELVTRIGEDGERASGYDPGDYRRLADPRPQGPPRPRPGRRAARPAARAARDLPGARA